MTNGCDTHDMVVVHRVFRREFGLLPRLVKTVSPGDTVRARRVADHAQELLAALHHHDSGEDELLWPRLRERAPLSKDFVDLMELQHEQLAGLLAEVEELLPVWRDRAESGTQLRLTGVCAQVSLVLDEHLSDEERAVLPLVETHLNAQEWAELGQRGMAGIPKNRLLVFLAHILEEASPAERAEFLRQVPLPGRIAYRLIGKRQHRREDGELRAPLSDA